MAESDRMLGMYLHLVRASHLRRQSSARDKLLILASLQAHEMGLDTVVERCRHKILSNNPLHMVRQWPTLAEALAHGEFQPYIKQLKRRYSREKVEHILASLGIDLSREREAYFNDAEYANALLDNIGDAIGGLPKRASTPSEQSADPASGAPTRDSAPKGCRNQARVLAVALLSGLLAVGLALVARGR